MRTVSSSSIAHLIAAVLLFYFISPSLSSAQDAAPAPRSKNFFHFEVGEWGSDNPSPQESANLPRGWLVPEGVDKSLVTWVKNDPLTREHISPAGDKLNKLLRLNLPQKTPVKVETGYFGVEPGGAYILNGHMKTAGNFTSKTWLSLYLYDGDKQLIKEVQSSIADFSFSWKEMSSDYFTVPRQCSLAKIVINSISKSTPGTVWLDQIFLYHFNFNFEVDNDDDNIPDNWERYIDEPAGFRAFPRNNAAIDREDVIDGNNILRMDVREGSVAMQTENLIPVGRFDSFRFSGYAKTGGNSLIDAQFQIVLYDSNRNRLPASTIRFDPLRGKKFWGSQPYRRYIEEIKPHTARYARIRVVLHGNGAVNGAAYFDKITFIPLPRILALPKHSSIDPKKVDFDPEKLFIFPHNEKVDFRIIAENLVEDKYTYSVLVKNFWDQEIFRYVSPEVTVDRKTGRRFQLKTPFKIQENGFMSMEIQLLRRGILESGRHIFFGCLSQPFSGDEPNPRMSLSINPLRGDCQVLIPLIQEMEIGQIKIPIWFPDLTLQNVPSENARRLNYCTGRLRQLGIEPVGVFAIDWLPLELADKVSQHGTVLLNNMNDVLRGNQALWGPYISKQVNSLGSAIGHWQLADDSDDSINSQPSARQQISSFNSQVTSTASWAKVASPIGIPALTPLPKDLDYYVQRIPRDYDWPEIRKLLDANALQFAGTNLHPFWYNIGVSDNQPEGRQGRIQAMARQIVEVLRRPYANLVFDKFADDISGLIRDNLQPKAEYFAYRILSDLIGSAAPGPSLMLGNPEMHNQVFYRGANDLIMVLWTDNKELEQEMYLGEDLVRVDLMGNRKKVGQKNMPYLAKVTPMPTLYTGINRELLMTRLSFKVDKPDLDSTETPQERVFSLVNHFQQPLSGTVRLYFPPSWHFSPRKFSFTNLQPGKSMPFPVKITVN
ncbi:hypothetical protein ACFL54_09360, partial [Planctomycetota bacterium]